MYVFLSDLLQHLLKKKTKPVGNKWCTQKGKSNFVFPFNGAMKEVAFSFYIWKVIMFISSNLKVFVSAYLLSNLDILQHLNTFFFL